MSNETSIEKLDNEIQLLTKIEERQKILENKITNLQKDLTGLITQYNENSDEINDFLIRIDRKVSI
jgi:RNA binding exosome subunit